MLEEQNYIIHVSGIDDVQYVLHLAIKNEDLFGILLFCLSSTAFVNSPDLHATRQP